MIFLRRVLRLVCILEGSSANGRIGADIALTNGGLFLSTLSTALLDWNCALLMDKAEVLLVLFVATGVGVAGGLSGGLAWLNLQKN